MVKLYRYLSDQTICLDLQNREKNGAIAELASLLKGHTAVVDFDQFLGAIFAREMGSTTGIGSGVGIPHARTDSVKNFVAAVGIARAGIDFASTDGKPVKLLILMGIPAVKVKAYLRLLAHLSLLLKQSDFVRGLLEAPDTETVLKTFAQHEE